MLGILKEKFHQLLNTEVISNLLIHSNLCTIEYTSMCGCLASAF